MNLFFILLIYSTASAAVFFVKPTNLENSSCPDEPCQTLDQYAQHSSAYFTVGSTFIFLAGNHSLQNTVTLFEISNITFTKWGNYSSGDVNILCKSKVAILCKATTQFEIQGLDFWLSFDHDSSCISMLNSTKVTISNSTFLQESGYQSTAHYQALISMRSNFSIENCLFKGITDGAINVEDSVINLSGNIFIENMATGSGGAVQASGGSLIIHQGNLFTQNSASIGGGAISCEKHCILNITGSKMSYESLSISNRSNRIEFRENTAPVGGGITIDNYSTMISNAENLYFISNMALYQGGAIHAWRSSVVLGGENVSSNHYFFYNHAGYGGAIYVEQSLTLGENSMHYFFNNTASDGGAIYFGNKYFPIGSRNNNVTLKGNITFKYNSAATGGGASLYFSNFLQDGNVLLSNNEGYQIGGGIYVLDSTLNFEGFVVLQENFANEGGGAICAKKSSLMFAGPSAFNGNEASSGGAIYAFYGTTITFINNVHQFSHNRATLNGGAIYAAQCNIETNGTEIHFSLNCASNGGAMYFGSLVIFTVDSFTHLYSTSNSATEYGGSIYYDDSSATSIQCKMFLTQRSKELLPSCFLQFKGWGARFYDQVYGYVYSKDDHAGKDGSFLYGGLLDRCYMEKKDLFQNHIVPYNFLWSQTFHLTVQDNKTRNVTSKPYQLCFCTDDQTYDCSGTKAVLVNRGQTFNLSVLALDQMKSVISAHVNTQTAETARVQFDQITTEHCTNLTFKFYSTKNREKFILYLNSPCRDYLAQAIVNVTISQCPDGFIQSHQECICEERLQKYSTMCGIEEAVFITKEANSKFWMGALYLSDGHYEGLVLYKTCPFDYCKQVGLNLSLQSLDKQCNVNRGKVLCGACVNNSSLMLGGFQCGVCSNRYLALLILFTVAGIVLVIFLSVLRLTVATGMINGVILYANIVQVNRVVFFPDNPHNILTVFIAWLNLDLGFQTCFYDGMTAYAQTWLQFFFPLYVWILIAFIILSSRYSIIVSKLIGHNPIAVLATLLLMSYTKLLKIIIEVYSSVDLDYPDNKTVRVWLKDANVPYLKSWHLLLTVVTTLILVLLFIPYTLLLLFGYKLYHYSTKKCLHWLIKVKPLLDSYYAPYEIHTRYWTGLLLLVRCGLYIVFSYNSLGGTSKSLVIINITFVILVIIAWLSVRVYSSFFLNVMEALIYLNLVVLSATILAGVSSSPLVHTMIGVVFATMMCIIIYHLYLTYVSKSALWLKIKAEVLNKIKKSSNNQKVVIPLSMKVTDSVVDLRESLLDSSN